MPEGQTKIRFQSYMYVRIIRVCMCVYIYRSTCLRENSRNGQSNYDGKKIAKENSLIIIRPSTTVLSFLIIIAARKIIFMRISAVLRKPTGGGGGGKMTCRHIRRTNDRLEFLRTLARDRSKFFVRYKRISSPFIKIGHSRYQKTITNSNFSFLIRFLISYFCDFSLGNHARTI